MTCTLLWQRHDTGSPACLKLANRYSFLSYEHARETALPPSIILIGITSAHSSSTSGYLPEQKRHMRRYLQFSPACLDSIRCEVATDAAPVEAVPAAVEPDVASLSCWWVAPHPHKLGSHGPKQCCSCLLTCRCVPIQPARERK